MFRNLIFDWSGTLCDDLSLTLEATNYVLSRYDCAPLTLAAFRDEFKLPYPDYYAWKLPQAKLEDLENDYRYAFDHSDTPVQLLPHAKQFMQFCASLGIRCFALTSMDPKAFDEQARSLGIMPFFEHVHSGIHNKEHYIHTVMEMHGLRPQDTAFIGDMQHDIAAAHRAGITAIGVLTGYNNALQLSEAKPDFTVPNLATLQQIMQRSLSAPQPDAIRINGLEFTCNIGVPEEERAIPQRVSADIEFQPPHPLSAMEDDIDLTIDYEQLAHRLIALAQEEPTRLLETLAHRFARYIVTEFGALRATATLHKFVLEPASSSAVRASFPSE